MSIIIIFVLSAVLLTPARGYQRTSWFTEIEDMSINDLINPRSTNEEYRLPKNVVPLAYDIFIDLYFSERTNNPFSYDGKEYIVIQAVENNVRQIVLHANVDSVNEIKLFDYAGVEVTQNSLQFETEPLYHFLKINLDQPLNTGPNYTLFIDYSSTMNEGPMKRGIWRGYYTDHNGIERIYAATHFQPYNARQAFPCWDEPGFKSVFKLHLSKPSSYSGTFTNTRLNDSVTLAGNRVRNDYLETPRMSSYLVTFLVSETFQVIAQNTSFNPPIRIIGRSNTVGLGFHALNHATQMTSFFDQYFDLPYSSLHPNLQNDHISSPDWASGGTENWGMISYRELHVIVDPHVSLMSVEHYSATLVSHELAHNWFGNYITCHWWSNTWINEGFASYFGYIATHEVFPEYEMHDHFNTRYLQTSLATDSGTSVAPLNNNVNTPAQVTGHFGTISYSKGAAFLRMTANIISLETFKKTCRHFLAHNRYQATDQYDLLQSFIYAIEEDNSLAAYGNFNFTEYYRIWVNEPGAPILTVNVNHSTGEISLSQERFFLSSSATSLLVYPIPITYSTKRNPNFNVKPIAIMTSASHTLNKEPGEEWVIFNNLQHGYYRVNYDETTWGLIAETLRNTPNEISYLNRAQIVDDVFALIRSDRMTHKFGFDILRFLANESNFHVWDPAISGYTWIRNRLRHIPDKLAEYDAYLLSQMEHAITTLGFEPTASETTTTTMARESILHFACTLGHTRCNEESWNRFVNWRDSTTYSSVHARVRRNVYTTAMRRGNQTDFEFLLNHFYQSNYANDRLEMLRGLGATRNTELLNRYLSLTLTQDVRSHDKLNSFNYALLGNQENAVTVLQFVQNNVNQLRVAYVEDSPARPVHSALSNLASYLDEAKLDEYENWARTTQSHIPQFANIISAIQTARNNIAWGTANADIIIEATKSNAAVAIATLVLVISMIFVTILI